MNNKCYHLIDTENGDIVDTTYDTSDKLFFDYVRAKKKDSAFFTAWRKAWPGINPKLSNLKLYRKWLKVDENYMANVGFPPEWHRKALMGKRFG